MSLNGAPLGNATNAWLVIDRLATNRHGVSSVSGSNRYGSIFPQFNLSMPAPLRLRITDLSTNGCELSLSGTVGSWISLEGSTDLRRWEALRSWELIADLTRATVPLVPSQNTRFFRATYFPMDDVDDA